MANNVNMTVNISANSSGLLTGLSNAQNAVNRAQQNMNRSAQQNATNQNRQQSRQGGNAAYATMQAAQTLDDLQYGIRGVVNNIPMLLQSFGFGLGMAGVLSILAVVINQVVQNWDRFGSNMKKAIQDQVSNAQAVQNAAARLAKAKRELEESERASDARRERRGKSDNSFTEMLDDQTEAIENSIKAIKERQRLQQELDDASKEHELAKVAVSGLSPEARLQAEFDIEKKYRDKKNALVQESLKQEESAAMRESNIQERAEKDASKRGEYLEAYRKKQYEAEQALKSLQSEEAGMHEKALDIYRSLKDNQGQKLDSKATPLDIVNAALDAEKAKPMESGINMGQALILKSRLEEMPSLLDAAKSKVSEIGKDISGLGDPDKDLKNATEKKKQLQDQASALGEQAKKAEEIAKIEEATMKLREQKERDDMLKSAIADSLKGTSPIVDSITKIGGGGFIGSPESTNLMEKALREYKKQVTELKKSNDLLQQIRDKYPSFQP